MVPCAIALHELDAEWTASARANVVFYCAMGMRSGSAAARLRDRGVPAFNLVGILHWAHEYPVTDAWGAPVNRAHIRGPDWNLATVEVEVVFKPPSEDNMRNF